MATIPTEAHEMTPLDRDRLHALVARERAAYVAANPRSRELFRQAAGPCWPAFP